MPLPAKQVTLTRNEEPVTFLSLTTKAIQLDPADPAVTTAATTLELRQQVVRVTVATTTGREVVGKYTITLPNVAEAKGMWFSVIASSLYATATDATSSVVITHGIGGSEQWTDITLNNTWAGEPAAPVIEGVLLFSDGLKWWTAATLGDLTQ